MSFSPCLFELKTKNLGERPKDNALKNQLLATLCTGSLKKSLCGLTAQGGQGKGGAVGREDRATKRGEATLQSRLRSRTGGEIAREAVLRRDSEEKLDCGAAIAAEKALNCFLDATPWRQPPEAKDDEVCCRFLPWRILLPGAYRAEIVKPRKRSVSPAKPLQNHPKPAGNEPGSCQTVRVHLDRCPIESLLTTLPASKRQKQDADHRTDRVLKVRDQLKGQERKGPSLLPAQKPRNGYALFPEFREQFSGLPQIRGDLTIAIRAVANWTHRADGTRKINLAGKKRFSVFPKIVEFVKIGQLNFSAPARREAGFGPLTFGPASLLSVVAFLRLIPYLAHSPNLISSVKLSCKYQSLCWDYTAVNNTASKSPFRSTVQILK